MDPLRSGLPLVALVALVTALRAATPTPGWVLPPIDGDFSGELTPLVLPGAPSVRWSVSVRSSRPRERSATLSVDGPGVTARGAAVLDPAGEGTWTLTEAKVDLREWFGWLAPRFWPDAATAEVSGDLVVRGAGSWRGGQWNGRLEVALRDGRYDDAASKVRLDGLHLDLVLEDWRSRRTAAGQVLTWQGGRFDALNFGAGRVEFSLDGEALQVDAATLAVLGGELQVRKLTMSTRNADLAVTARVQGIDLGQLLGLLPPVLASARGRVDGRIALRRDAEGIQIGTGRLSLRPGETAELRLSPTPGLLSAQLPATVRQHYPGLGAMETGGIPLRAERLELTLTPAGDAEGRTAAVHIEGGPADPTLRAPVVLQVNVRGPLQSLVKFGTNPRLRFGGTH